MESHSPSFITDIALLWVPSIAAAWVPKCEVRWHEPPRPTSRFGRGDLSETKISLAKMAWGSSPTCTCLAHRGETVQTFQSVTSPDSH